jgi:SAM-dependent methyltransferase
MTTPSPIDFHDPAQARAWEENTIRIRPFRPHFFAAFVSAIKENSAGAIAILELRSGPGHLAEQILLHCEVRRYVALDFSAAMHDIARERLVPLADRMEYVIRDFRSPDWRDGLGHFDAVVTLQAAHERVIAGSLPLLRAARACLRSDGLLLYCDHYVEEGSEKNPALYVAREAQPAVLDEAGFAHIRRLRDEGGMALYCCRNYSGGLD